MTHEVYKAGHKMTYLLGFEVQEIFTRLGDINSKT